MGKKTALNFFIAIVLLGIYFGAGYYYFECHSMLDIALHRKWVIYSAYFSIGTGGISFLYTLITHKGSNSLLFIISWLMNLSFSAGIIWYAVEYGTLLIRGKILIYCAAIMLLFVLQTIVFFSMKKNLNGNNSEN
jgi:hypothetical protein